MAEAMTNEEVVGGNYKDKPAMEEELLEPEKLDGAARVEHGSDANMPLLLSGMTLPIPSTDSPDKSWQPAKLQSFRTRKLLVRQK